MGLETPPLVAISKWLASKGVRAAPSKHSQVITIPTDATDEEILRLYTRGHSRKINDALAFKEMNAAEELASKLGISFDELVARMTSMANQSTQMSAPTFSGVMSPRMMELWRRSQETPSFTSTSPKPAFTDRYADQGLLVFKRPGPAINPGKFHAFSDEPELILPPGRPLRIIDETEIQDRKYRLPVILYEAEGGSVRKFQGGLQALKRYLFHTDLFKPQKTAEVASKLSAREMEKLLEDRAALEALLSQNLNLDQRIYRGVDIPVKDFPQRGDIIGGSGGPASFTTSPGIARTHSLGKGPIIAVSPDKRIQGVVVPIELNPYESEVVLHPSTLLEAANVRQLKNGQPLVETWFTPDTLIPNKIMWKEGGPVQTFDQEGGRVQGGLEFLQSMVRDPSTYYDAVTRTFGSNPFSRTQREHTKLYNKMGDELRQQYGGKSGSITDLAKNYAGGWDYATRDPENAARKAQLWQFRDYALGALDKESQSDAGYDLEENLSGIRDALSFTGPPEPYKQLKQRAVNWAQQNPRGK